MLGSFCIFVKTDGFDFLIELEKLSWLYFEFYKNHPWYQKFYF
jgi:hypothetical protein